MAKKKEEEQEEGAPLWVLTFGDMMSLLLTFFILLFSMSTINPKKFADVLGAIQTVLGAGASIKAPPEEVTPKEVVRKLRAIIGKGISGAYEESVEGHHLKIQTVKEGLKITFGGRPLFAEGSAEINPSAVKVLQKLGGLTKGYRNKIRILGHAAGAPGDGLAGPEGKWTLGFARAMAVRRFLVEQSGVRPARLEAASAAQFQPARPEEEEPGAVADRGKENRRVELIVTEELIPWSLLN